MANELVFLNQEQLELKLKEQIDEKGIDNMIYKLPRGNKLIMSYDKPTLEQLRIDLGLRADYTQTVTPIGNGQVYINTKCDLIRFSDNQIVASAYAGGSSHESINGGFKDMVRISPTIDKRALSNALTPWLVRFGLDYKTMVKKYDLKVKNKKILEKEIQFTSNAEDIPQEDGNETTINTNEMSNLLLLASDNKQLRKEIEAMLKTNHNYEGKMTKASIMKLTKQEYKILVPKKVGK